MGDFSICFSEHLTGHPSKLVSVILVKRKRGKTLIFKYLTPTSGLRIAFPRDKTIKIQPTLRDIIDLSPRLMGERV